MIRRLVSPRLLATITLLLAAAVAEGASTRIEPSSSAGTIDIRVSGRQRAYDLTTDQQPLEFKIRGPIAVRVLSRYLFDAELAEEPGSIDATLRLEIDGVELRTLALASGVSSKATLDGEPVGALSKQVVQIPAGSHTVRLVPGPGEATVALRLFRGDGRQREVKRVPFAPETYEQAVRLHSRDSEVIYYRFSMDHPVTFSMHGPAQLEILTRLDFGRERGYSQSYTVKAFIGDELWQACALTSRASHVSTYPELPEITPGVGRVMLIDVPEGRHDLTIALDCTTAKSAALQIRIPESAVTNGS